jgi:hypothetical protein
VGVVVGVADGVGVDFSVVVVVGVVDGVAVGVSCIFWGLNSPKRE